MKKMSFRGAVLAFLLVSGMPLAAQTGGNASFEKLKGLAGEWSGTAKGQPVTASYRVVSNGSAIEETLRPTPTETMITMYHLDGQRIMATHYCAAGNQPRMVAVPDTKDPNVVAFKFLDATNLKSPEDGHMRDLTVTIQDNDHFTQQWKWRDHGKEENMELFQYTRKK
jgi:hypothetical protein